jgi:hypothetical protein
MKTKNNLTTGILLGIGVIVLPLILMSSTSTTNNEMVYESPESHVWEMVSSWEGTDQQRVYTLNKVTGEVRKYSKKGMTNGKLKDQYYQVLTENKEGEK